MKRFKSKKLKGENFIMSIHITFPDGAVKPFDSGVTTFDVAKSISNSLAKKALAGKFNGVLIDLDRPIAEDGSLEIVTPDHEDALGILRHSSAHLMANALRRLFPNIKFGVGPAIDSGFYYDTDNGESPVTAEDLPAIIIRQSFENNHLAGIPFVCCLYSSAAYLIGLQNIYAGSAVRSRALQRT